MPQPRSDTGVTERGWQRTVVECFEHFGYLVCHVYPLATKTGFRTSTTLKGWPDVTGIGTRERGGFVLYIECKGPKTPVTAEQLIVLDELSKGEQNRAWLLRPMDDLTDLVRWISRPVDAPRTYGFTPEDVTRARSRARV